MSVEAVSAEELAGLDLDLDEDGEPQLQSVSLAEEAAGEVSVGDSQALEAAVVAEAGDEAEDEEDDLGFVEDGQPQTVDPYGEAEQAYYSQVADGADGEEEEYEEEQQADPDLVVAAETAEETTAAATAAGPAGEAGDEAEEDDDEDIMFFEDTAAVAVAVAPASEIVEEFAGEEELQDAAAGVPVQLGVCGNCGVPGHDTTKCPFGHPEDIQLGDMAESDSDDDLPEQHPTFARYVSQHTGALVPKIKKGLTGQGRFFGEDKPYRQCWVCGAEDHESNDCKLKRCFFCGESGHDSRVCSEKAKICSHCRCKGHLPVACPTMASQELVSFTSTHCLSCGAFGHVNCGPPPLSLQAQRPVMPQVENGQLTPASRIMALASRIGRPMLPPQQSFVRPPPSLFNMGLPPPTPCSPPPSPLAPASPMNPSGNGAQVVRPRMPLRLPPPGAGMSKATASFLAGAETSKASSLPGGLDWGLGRPTGMSKAGASMAFLNGGAGTMHTSKSGNMVAPGKGAGKAPITKVLGQLQSLMPKGGGKAAIAKVPGKAPITKTPGKAPITKGPGTVNKDFIMKSSAKRPSNGENPALKRAKGQGKAGGKPW